MCFYKESRSTLEPSDVDEVQTSLSESESVTGSCPIHNADVYYIQHNTDF